MSYQFRNMKILFLLLTFLFLNFSTGEDAFNKMIDRELLKLEEDLKNHVISIPVIKLPDAKVSFKKNFLWYNLYGDVELKDGLVESLNGLKKIGDATLVTTNSGEMIITMSVSWSDLKLHYGLFKYKYLFMNMNDSLTVSVKDNSVFLNATFTYGQHDSCHMTINTVQVEKFSGFSTTIVPEKWYEFLNDLVVDYAMSDQSVNIISEINAQLMDNVNGVIYQLDLCNYLPY